MDPPLCRVHSAPPPYSILEPSTIPPSPNKKPTQSSHTRPHFQEHYQKSRPESKTAPPLPCTTPQELAAQKRRTG
ncbi:uncharacterized protein CC84DRAFT_1165018 [Paraphaeosphaeria sporulosa]|uniref:Uncharacterized protein n=1 Tax=Paraphaeosphaeria sporulosa TaxID=1460663 RepID=A0A177CCQ5_9PLEO|nr:uncharacterized protein CC84DRAFT_1165018 [Paraphaeosphaeria sporulosa]OAG04587.1 hypothetical protein CC84DRAFT_1165018 [Paraphaeosphaeria sporulosa]